MSPEKMPTPVFASVHMEMRGDGLVVRVFRTVCGTEDRVTVSNHRDGLSRALELRPGVPLIVSSLNPKKRNQGRLCRYERMDNVMAYVQFLDDGSYGRVHFVDLDAAPPAEAPETGRGAHGRS